MYRLASHVVAGTLLLLPALAQSASVPASGARISERSENQIHLVGECRQLAGPYVTQTTAWQGWRQARGQGYAVSNSVVPCNDGSGAYCFYVYYPC
jgi:hypothetical protein